MSQRVASPRRRRAGAIVAAILLAGCAAPPEIPLGADGEPDAILVEGRDQYGLRCSACHANDGGGGRGPKLNDGQALERYPEIDAMLLVIAEGKGSGMPAFGELLTAEERRAVARYVREVLD